MFKEGESLTIDGALRAICVVSENEIIAEKKNIENKLFIKNENYMKNIVFIIFCLKGVV